MHTKCKRPQHVYVHNAHMCYMCAMNLTMLWSYVIIVYNLCYTNYLRLGMSYIDLSEYNLLSSMLIVQGGQLHVYRTNCYRH